MNNKINLKDNKIDWLITIIPFLMILILSLLFFLVSRSI